MGTLALTDANFEARFIVDDDGDMLEFSSVYRDDGLGFATEIASVDYPITAKTGKFLRYNVATIRFDNDGSVYGTTCSRKITFS